jgi:hypothetical protein
VLVHASEHAGIDGQPYLEVVPDLLWSVQDMDAGERGTLMRLLPKLVQRVKGGLQLIGMSDEEVRPVMDELVAMHAEVLRTIQAERIVPSIPLADLHRHFSTLRIGGAADMEASAIHAPTVPRERLQAALKKFNVPAHLHLDSDIGTLQSVDIKWLGGMQPGISIEWWHDNGYLPATLVWVDQQQSFYLFKLANRNEPKEEDEESARLLIYSSIALIKGLREGSVGMAEAAPVFDRAIESLLQDAGDPASPASF